LTSLPVQTEFVEVFTRHGPKVLPPVAQGRGEAPALLSRFSITAFRVYMPAQRLILSSRESAAMQPWMVSASFALAACCDGFMQRRRLS
ncbi:MAG: hypothetical protein WCP86_07665, partial [bacterium]